MLFCLKVVQEETRRFNSVADTQSPECQANTLIHGMRRNTQVARDFFRRPVLGDEQQAHALSNREPSHTGLYVADRQIA